MTLPKEILVVHKIRHPQTGRDHCSWCARKLATGQAACVCGATFEARLTA